MKIVFLDAYSLGDADLSPLKELGDYTSYQDTACEDTVRCAEGAEVIITNKVRIGREVIERLPQLKLICVAATGVNNIDVEFAQSIGIEVKNVPGYSTESVAEATIGYVLALKRNLSYYDRYVKDGSYSKEGRIFHLARPISEIGGKEWGIIGLGAIGSRVAELAEAFGAKVSYYSFSDNGGNGRYARKNLEDLLSGSDIVSIHCMLTPQSRGLITYDRLRLMKPSSLLVNVARGTIVDEEALARAINEGVIAGAGIDVFSHEPVRGDSPLFSIRDRDRIICAPHCGWASSEARRTLVANIAENIRRYFAASGSGDLTH